MRNALRRFISLVFLTFAIFVCTRLLLFLLPGDPIATLLAESGSTANADEIRHELGLNLPLTQTLWKDLTGLLQGNLGRSILSRQPVAPILLTRFLATLQIALLTTTVMLAISIPLALAAAQDFHPRLRKVAYSTLEFLGSFTAAMPTVWTGPLLAYFFGVYFQWLPVGGHWALPVLTLSLYMTGNWSRLMRARFQEGMHLPSTTAALARGLPHTRVLLKYAALPQSGALIAFLGTSFGSLLTGALVTEILFDWPGMGSLFIESVLKRDYPLVQGCVFIGSIASLLGTWGGDALRAWIDPREANDV